MNISVRILTLAHDLVNSNLNERISFSFYFQVNGGQIRGLNRGEFTGRRERGGIVRFVIFISVHGGAKRGCAGPVVNGHPDYVFTAKAQARIFPHRRCLSTMNQVVRSGQFCFISLLIMPPITRRVFAGPFFINYFRRADEGSLIHVRVLWEGKSTN